MSPKATDPCCRVAQGELVGLVWGQAGKFDAPADGYANTAPPALHPLAKSRHGRRTREENISAPNRLLDKG